MLARIVEPVSEMDSLRVLDEAGLSPPSYATVKRRLPEYAMASWRQALFAACAGHAGPGPPSLVPYDVGALYFETEAGTLDTGSARRMGGNLEPRVPGAGMPQEQEVVGAAGWGIRWKGPSAMTTTTHKRSVHIDAAVETVFDYVKDPQHFYDAMSEGGRDALTDVTLTPEGVVSTYAWKSTMLLLHIHGVMTREEYIPNERIVDRSSTGPVWTWTFEPDPTGTTLSLAFEWSTKVPLMDKVVDLFAWNGDRDLDTILTNLKKEIET